MFFYILYQQGYKLYDPSGTAQRPKGPQILQPDK